MPLTIIRESPDESIYTPIAEYQSATPESFTVPVLHGRYNACKLLVSEAQFSKLPILGEKPTKASGQNDSAQNGEDETEEDNEDVAVESIDCWITNEHFILYNTSEKAGVKIPYPSITLHAIQRMSADSTGVYLQISLTPDVASYSNNDDFDEDDVLEITLIPTASGDRSQDETTRAAFKAMSDCASLHPDPMSDDENDDGEGIFLEGDRDGDTPRLDGFPGSGGWITAENVDQFKFEDNEELGPGAGTVRARSPDGEEQGAEEVDEAAKWRRTEDKPEDKPEEKPEEKSDDKSDDKA